MNKIAITTTLYNLLLAGAVIRFGRPITVAILARDIEEGKPIIVVNWFANPKAHDLEVITSKHSWTPDGIAAAMCILNGVLAQEH